MAVSTIDALYNGTSEKLTTSATGITVTGETSAGSRLVLQNKSTGVEVNSSIRHHTNNYAYMFGGTNGLIFANNASENTRIKLQTGNEIEFITSSTNRMVIDSSGAVTMPYQPAFMAVKNAGQLNMPINVYNTVTFGNEVFDRNADYDGSTTFTAPITGVYQANIKVRIDQVDNQANYYLVRLQTSNRHYYTITDFDGSSGDPTYSTHSFSQLIDMDAGDTAYIQAYQSGGSVQSDYDNDSGSSQFSMFLVA